MYNIEHNTIVSGMEQDYCAEQGMLVGHILTGKHLILWLNERKKNEQAWYIFLKKSFWTHIVHGTSG